MTETASFYITVPLDRLDAVRQALRQTGIDLDPVRDMLHIPGDSVIYSLFTGADGQYAADRMNEYLNQSTESRRIGEFSGLSDTARRDLLELATVDTCWTSDDRPAIDEISYEALQAFLHSHGQNPD